jgi:prepilin-type processing-associated H-X9-DG protein
MVIRKKDNFQKTTDKLKNTPFRDPYYGQKTSIHAFRPILFGDGHVNISFINAEHTHEQTNVLKITTSAIFVVVF